MGKIAIVFDGPPGPEGGHFVRGRFVEAEDADGGVPRRSVGVGTWERHPEHPDWHEIVIDVPTEDTVFVVLRNSDLTEGRGHDDVIAVCRKRSTAVRLAAGRGVQGTCAPVEKRDAIVWRGGIYIRHAVIGPSERDMEAEAVAEARTSGLAKLAGVLSDAERKALGLSA